MFFTEKDFRIKLSISVIDRLYSVEFGKIDLIKLIGRLNLIQNQYFLNHIYDYQIDFFIYDNYERITN